MIYIAGRRSLLNAPRPTTVEVVDSVATTLSTMDYAYQGAPFVEGAVDSDVNTNLMNFSYQGIPFVRWVS